MTALSGRWRTAHGDRKRFRSPARRRRCFDVGPCRPVFYNVRGVWAVKQDEAMARPAARAGRPTVRLSLTVESMTRSPAYRMVAAQQFKLAAGIAVNASATGASSGSRSWLKPSRPALRSTNSSDESCKLAARAMSHALTLSPFDLGDHRYHSSRRVDRAMGRGRGPDSITICRPSCPSNPLGRAKDRRRRHSQTIAAYRRQLRRFRRIAKDGDVLPSNVRAPEDRRDRRLARLHRSQL